MIRILLVCTVMLGSVAALYAWLEGRYLLWRSAGNIETRYDAPLPAPTTPIAVYHLGHSLVGKDMPAMVQQLAEAGHRYNSQIGWGTSLKKHWERDIDGLEASNGPSQYRDATEALASGEYDVFILTEMVEIRDAIRYHNSADYLNRWVDRAVKGNPDVRIYLYETWHPIDDPEGWLIRLDRDLDRYWEQDILDRAALKSPDLPPVYVIPAGQVFAHFVRALETDFGYDPQAAREYLFWRPDKNKLDSIHINEIGKYLVALTHYAALYHQSPVGLPYQLTLADGTPAQAPTPDIAQAMQQIVWDVVTAYPRTGVQQQGEAS